MTLPILPFSVFELPLNIRMEDSFRLQQLSGSMLRGIWGRSLRLSACMTGLPECGSCPLQATCPYTLLFDTPLAVSNNNAPNPYVIRPPEKALQLEAGDSFSFEMRLLGGTATERLAHIVYAWEQAFVKGIGRKRAKARLETAGLLDDDGCIQPLSPLSLPDTKEHASRDIEINFATPLRLQIQGKPQSVDQITPRMLTSAILRRLRTLAETHGKAPPEWSRDWPVDDWFAEADALKTEKQLHWQDWTRYSGRQKTTMTLGGITGTWFWRDVPAPLIRLLEIGSLIHAGKETVFGLGRIEVSGS